MQEHILEFGINQKNMFCFILIFMDYKQMNKKGFMKIPTNSTFTKEMSKRLQRIINPQTTLEELQNLQEEVNMINPVDSYLANQVAKLEKANATTKTVVQDARTVRSTESKGKRFVEKTIQDQTTQKRISF